VQVYQDGQWVDYYNVAQRGVPTSRRSTETVITGS
jgi:N-acetylmuramoyl-L-alanine amidase